MRNQCSNYNTYGLRPGKVAAMFSYIATRLPVVRETKTLAAIFITHHRLFSSDEFLQFLTVPFAVPSDVFLNYQMSVSKWRFKFCTGAITTRSIMKAPRTNNGNETGCHFGKPKVMTD